MLQLENNREMDLAFQHIIDSMVDMEAYLERVLQYVGAYLTKSDEGKLINFLRTLNIPDPTLKWDVDLLKENPYYKNITLENIKTDTVSYVQEVIPRRTLINMDFHKPLGKYLFHHHPVGYFDEDIVLPVLVEGDRVWMSPTVSELNSMKPGIDKGRGHCLTLGLGLGMLPYLWLLKEEVTAVTVVEFNPDVIRLFDAYIRPQFPQNKPLTIIQGNGVDYYNEAFLSQFDYVYVDFWESNEDGLMWYTKLMEQEVELPHVDFWIEDSILCDVQYAIAMYLLNLYRKGSIHEYLASLDEGLLLYTKKAHRYFRTRTDTVRTEDELLSVIHDKKVVRKILAQKV